MQYEFIPIVENVEAAISREHRFTTDSVLLANFAAPKRTEKVAEFCCGCGAISLMWFGEGGHRPKQVVGFELMEEAVELFNLSIEKNNFGELMEAVNCDLKNYKNIPQLKSGTFDMVVCNPPYFEEGFGNGARKTARQEADLDIYEVCRAATYALKYGGRFCVCFKPQRMADLFEAMRQSKIEPKTIRPVLSKAGEAPYLVLVEGRRGGKPQLNWLPAWVLYEDNGDFTEQYREIYKMR